MTKLIAAIRELSQMVLEMTRQQSRLSTALNDITHEQRITNLIVRSQLATDPVEKERPAGEAAHRMDSPRRRSRHEQP